MTDLSTLTLVELRTLEGEVKTAKALRKEVEKGLVTAEKLATHDKFKGTLKEGDLVTFKYGIKVASGTVVRVSDKSATVKSADFTGKKDQNYVAFDRFLTAETAVDEIVEDVEVQEAV